MPAGAGPPELSRLALLQKCTQIIETFDPKRTTVDAWAEDAEILKDRSLGDVELKFIHQVFYGCVRYQKFLKLFVTSFMYRCPSQALRAEQPFYTVLAYLLFFRLEELGVAEFRQFFVSGCVQATASLELLRYALDQEELEKWVKMEWCKLYDMSYIENDIIGKLQNLRPELQPLLDEVEFKATGTAVTAEGTLVPTEKRRVTEAKPFNLTRPKPRLIPEPEVIVKDHKAKPPPMPGPSLSAVEEEKRQRLEEEKARVAAKYSAVASTAPRQEPVKGLSSKEREELSRKEVEERELKACTFAPAVKPYKPPREENAPVVKTSAVAVLREDALLRQKQAKEAALLKEYEQGGHDASEFSRWQVEMKEKDERDEQLRVQQRIVEMQLAREGAIEAAEADRRKKNIIAQAQREEAKAFEEARAQAGDHLLAGKQQLVDIVQSEREHARQATEAMLKARADAAEVVRAELEAEMERKKREDELEMERRKDIIRQIRALERVPVEKFKMFDPAEAPCQGLLEEMSLAELRERLALAAAKQQKEVEDKRGYLLEKKEQKQQELNEKVETLAKIRDKAKAEAEYRSAEAKRKKQEQEEMVARHREKAEQEVALKIQLKKQRKREEELRLKKELKEIAAKQQFLAAGAEQQKAKMAADIFNGNERDLRARQAIAMREHRKEQLIVARDHAQRATNKQRETDDYRQMQADVNDRVRRAKSADAALKEDIVKATVAARQIQSAHTRKLQSEIGHGASKYTRRLTP